MKKYLSVAFFLLMTLSLFAGTEDGVFYLYTPDRPDILTSSGREFDELKYTCAHASLPFGSKITIIYNKKQISVEVTDRINMPDNCFALSRAVFEYFGIIDLSCFTASCILPDNAEGEGEVVWKKSTANEKYCDLTNIKSDDLFTLYNKLIFNKAKNYNARFENDSLTVMYVSDSEKKALRELLSQFGVDVANIIERPLSRPPTRL